MRNPGNDANDTNGHSSDARSDRQPGVTIVRLPFRRPTAVERRVLSRQSAAQRALRLVAGLALLVGSGTGVLMLPFSVRTRPLTADEALFTAVSALSTSGLNVITPGVDLSLFGQIVLMVLMQVGGIGFMVGAVLVYQLLGIRLRFADRLALRDSMGLLSAGGIVRLMRNALIGVVVIESLGALVLWLNWMPLFGARRAAFFAIFHSVSAFTNASFDLFGGSPVAPAGFPTDAVSLLTISLLVILGSIGLPVLADVLRWPQQRRLSLHTRLTVATAAFLLVAGTISLFVAEQRPGTYYADAAWHRQVLLSFFHSATSRTSGFALAPLNTMAPAAVFTLITLMFIGGSPASMGGGITTSTFAILALELQSYVRGLGAPVVWRRRLPTELVGRAAAVLVASLALCSIVTWLLLLTHDATFDEALFEAVSAFTTCGYTLGLTARLDLFGRLLIAATMFWGRLGPLTVIVALSRARPGSNVEYPEEQVLL